MIEWVGYLASILVAISITTKGGFSFRIFNMAGSISFLVYGLLIGSMPVTLINIYSVGINIFHLARIKNNR